MARMGGAAAAFSAPRRSARLGSRSFAQPGPITGTPGVQAHDEGRCQPSSTAGWGCPGRVWSANRLPCRREFLSLIGRCYDRSSREAAWIPKPPQPASIAPADLPGPGAAARVLAGRGVRGVVPERHGGQDATRSTFSSRAAQASTRRMARRRGAPDPAIRFEKIALPQSDGADFTCVEVGPDHRLYAGTDDGTSSDSAFILTEPSTTRRSSPRSSRPRAASGC